MRGSHGLRRSLNAGVASAVLAAVLALIAPGDAKAGLWSAPATLGGADMAVTADVGIDAGGTAVLAWVDGAGVVRGVVRRPDHPFEPATTLAQQGGGAPAVALDGAGAATVAWARDGSLEMADLRAAGQGFANVPTGIGGVSGAPDVAFVAPGLAIVVWDGVDGAIHALSHETGGGVVALPDVSPGPGEAHPRLAAAGGHAVVAWTQTQSAPNQIVTRIRASVRPPGMPFGPPAELASGVVVDDNPPLLGRTGEQLNLVKVVVSETGAAEALIGGTVFEGLPGDVALETFVAFQPGAAWTAPQRLARIDDPVYGAALEDDVAAGRRGDALYVAGMRPLETTTMTFLARGRAAGATAYGDPSVLESGPGGEIRAAALAADRWLVLVRAGARLHARAGSVGTGFDAPMTFSDTDSVRLLGLEGAPSGLAAAAWVTTSGQLHAAIYDDSLGPASLPPAAARDTVAPIVSGLSVSPRRFAVRRAPRAAAAGGTRIRWRLGEPARVTLRRASAPRISPRRALRGPATAIGSRPALHSPRSRRDVHAYGAGRCHGDPLQRLRARAGAARRALPADGDRARRGG